MQLQFRGRYFFERFERNETGNVLKQHKTVILNDEDGVPHLSTYQKLSRELQTQLSLYISWKQREDEEMGIKYVSEPVYPFQLQAQELENKLFQDFSNPEILHRKEELEAYAKKFPALNYYG